LDDGVVLRSQACLIANAHLLAQHKQALNMAVMMLESIEARKQARNRSLLTAHVQVESPEQIQRLCQQLRSSIPGFEFRIATSDGSGSAERDRSIPYGYTISGVVRIGSTTSDLLDTVAVLRNMGASHIDVTPLTYRFEKEAARVRSLHERLKRLH
jgi:ATP phosphoribosyltransferase